MKSRNFVEMFKNAAGTVFLLAAAFFVCSTLLSMRAVLADPVAPQNQIVAGAAQSPRAGAQNPRSARSNSTGRTGGATNTTSAAPTSRNVSGRTTVASRSQANTTSSRGVVSRSNANARTNRAVVARTATNSGINTARVSLTGNAIRGSKSVSSSYTYLSNKLYTGNYSNIIDPTTGLISADAYSNCLESYYTCMDEICTARNAAQRRCACAGRVKAFSDAEAKLESANEELIKVSGELALLIATKGKDVSTAFQLTDAEKVMNCVSWRDASQNGTKWTDEYDTSKTNGKDWCKTHGIFDNSCSATTSPSYCKAAGNTFGFDVSNLDGNGSDILASLKSWADAKELTFTITETNNEFSGLTDLIGAVDGLTGIGGSIFGDEDALKDGLAQTWGYDLFAYAHNNVCSRVLDSCFNGIYEACGTPPSGRHCATGTTCPYNYNSTVTVTSTDDLNFIKAGSGSASNSATCFGYNSTSGDPYYNLRGPVADARRSVLQKYALDANADCDAYGEQLRKTAQNIGYQKVAAQQALQKKRLEFAQEETAQILNDAIVAGTNFNECISEIYDCYNNQVSANPSWSTSRIKTYCAQLANVPHCYEPMICNPSASQFKAIIDVLDSGSCNWSQDYTKNTCRNVVTLNEILTKASDVPAISLPAESANGDSAAIREKCLQDAIGTGSESLRNWQKPTAP